MPSPQPWDLGIPNECGEPSSGASAARRNRFGGLREVDLFRVVTGYAGAQRGGSLGAGEVVLSDGANERHLFRFETFFNGHEALTLGHWLRSTPKTV